MKLFLDCEFTNFQGHLISMAFVSEDDKEFYALVPFSLIDCDPWVVKNVIPVLKTTSIAYEEFQRQLKIYLRQWKEVEIIADWPEDFWHFTQALLTGPGTMIDTPKITMILERRLRYVSDLPHNALEDARAIKRSYMLKDTP